MGSPSSHVKFITVKKDNRNVTNRMKMRNQNKLTVGIILSFVISLIAACTPPVSTRTETAPENTPISEETTPSNTREAPLILESTSETPPILTPPPGSSTYITQPGDNLYVIAQRYEIPITDIIGIKDTPPYKLLKTGLQLIIPNQLSETSPGKMILPDSEVVFSPTAVDFDTRAYIEKSEGYLGQYWEKRSNGSVAGSTIIPRMALDYSLNPRLILSILEVQSHWVTREPKDKIALTYPMGWNDPKYPTLSFQVDRTLQILSDGYYGWREGSITEVTFADGSHMHLSPQLNAGSAALQYLFAQLYPRQEFEQMLYGPNGLQQVHTRLFGDPLSRDQSFVMLPEDLAQPVLDFPFYPGRSWNFTNGPHEVWRHLSARAALDFAPIGVSHCTESTEGVIAAAPGTIVRIGRGVVIVDLDGDQQEQVGWTLFYVHVSNTDHLQTGMTLKTGDLLGNPSCEGGFSTGTHLHLARKYNGEWVLADGAMPFTLAGWTVQQPPPAFHAGASQSEDSTVSWLVKGDQVIVSSLFSEKMSVVICPTSTPPLKTPEP